jgi:hypothetical protein
MLLNLVNKITGRFGYRVKVERLNFPYDIFGNKEFMEIYNKCKDYTMTSPERMYSLYNSIEYVIANKIEGDLAECGVWKGGSSMLMALLLKRHGVTDKKIYLYDTFEGMSEPSPIDKTAKGVNASTLLDKQRKDDENSIWCYSPIEEVKKALFSTGFPQENLIFIKGKVEDTLLQHVPGKLSILRLDTDWYESTKIELQILYPLLSENGVLIIDDFGHWEGARKAVMEYFTQNGNHQFLHRIDYTGRLIIKTQTDKKN